MKRLYILVTILLLTLAACDSNTNQNNPAQSGSTEMDEKATAGTVIDQNIEQSKAAIEKTKESLGEASEKALDVANSAVEETKESLGEASEKALDVANSAVEKTKEVTADIIEESKKIATGTVTAAAEKVMATASELKSAVSDTSAALSTDDGLALAKKSGCLACHSIEKKIVGPAWQDVAARYTDDQQAREKLISKVSKGGKGNWTEVTGGTPMPPYSPRVTDADIAQLVDFVLSLK